MISLDQNLHRPHHWTRCSLGHRWLLQLLDACCLLSRRNTFFSQHLKMAGWCSLTQGSGHMWHIRLQ
ncbi:hypothetical protein SORBI_3001G243150 [Sorghum bicolor]|uniref:Uncharacterized protein n=1 Tax=Sorghum bicolor TaxID=4558 RepID=A0A1Z5S751_SORBI|nr:hypothetical protein SORBI_3001G243150 [Sorghum bicolor]